MKKLILFFSLFLSVVATAQVGTKTDTTNTKKTTPRDGFHDNTAIEDRHNLNPTTPHERDVSFSKIIWREIVLAEKQNKFFIAEAAPFLELLFKGIDEGKITAYSAQNDNFTIPLTILAAKNTYIKYDTVTVCFAEEYDPRNPYYIIEMRTTWQDVPYFRIKEGWYFDEATAKMEQRILGIAPIQKKVNNNGEIMGYRPLFWIYYPQAHDFLAKQTVANLPNTSWADIFDKRLFGSHITKENNLSNNRLKDTQTEKDALLEAEKLKQQMQNREADRFED
jgi:gliding motility associated protien GldN